ncbi:KPN_02809 family neutral zinc metallopeptidase [Tautonia rosea]|uniref:KPN_02809 family neutral zinc metallopeptidase n=1 Tax=Tautonia rosea TaxID=2728037 RepID=UPI001473FB57|nr:neutral zinc metallopeptidase [Tautonia rosea]
MRWEGRRQSDNIEDRRGIPTRGLVVGGGLGTLILFVVLLALGVDPQALLQQMPPADPGAAGVGVDAGPRAPVDPEQERQAEFVSVVLADTEDVWTELFASQVGQPYEVPKLVLFTGSVNTDGCGFAGAAVGPFYCPLDRKAYLDLSFFDELSNRFGADGDFARAYVVAHEIGHHVQNLLGISDEVRSLQQSSRSEEEANRLSVRLELQADFLAGVWAHHADRLNQILESGDIEEALRAANAIGDDTLQRQAQGQVVPDSFTHGSSEQRVRWFRRGYQTGNLELIDELFSVPYNQL